MIGVGVGSEQVKQKQKLNNKLQGSLLNHAPRAQSREPVVVDQLVHHRWSPEAWVYFKPDDSIPQMSLEIPMGVLGG